MSGENQEEPTLGANGAGKSSVWDALCWVLYGETARRIRGPSVANTEGDGSCFVEAVIDGRLIRRTRKPNKLTLDGSVVDQATIDDFVGLSSESFKNTILMGQFSRFFFDLQPAEKLNLFSKILDLDMWMDASKRATAALKKCDDHLRQLEQDKAAADARISTLEEQAVILKAKKKEFDEELEEKIWRCEQVNKTDKGACSELKKGMVRSAKVTAKIRREHEKTVRKVEGLEVEVRSLRRETPEKRREYDRILMSLEELEKRLIVAKESRKCPACNQLIPKAKRDKLIKALEQEIELGRTHQVDTDPREAERMLEEKEKTLTESDKHEREVRERLAKAKREESEQESSFREITRRVESREETIRQLKEDGNPYDDDLKQHNEKIEEARSEVKRVTDELREERTVLDALSYWPKGFKDVRLWIIERALLDLEVAVNNSLVELGMPDWRVSFDVERETKAGTVSRGFTVLIHPPTGDPLPWESWSGGETQRLRIAGAAALADLIAARTGTSWGLEVWDEPTAHLSDEGVEDLLAWFAGRAETRQIWLVDHRALDAGTFAGEVRIVKTAEGSQIVPLWREGRPGDAIGQPSPSWTA